MNIVLKDFAHMRGRLIGLWLFSLVIMTGCISTSSEPEIVRSEIVPNNTPTVGINITNEPAETVADVDPTPVAESITSPDETPNATETATITIPDQFAIEGVLRNATTNTIAEGVEVNAALYENPAPDADTEVVALYDQTVVSGPDGRFRFDDIPTDLDFGLMIVTASYQNHSFPFAFFVPDDLDGPTKEIDLFIYEVTTDTTDLVFSSYNIFFGASPNENAAVVLVTVELTNQGNQLISDEPYSFSIPLPADALNIEIQIPPVMAAVLSETSFVVENTDSGPVIRGAVPLLPGRIFFQYSYGLVYQDDVTLTQAFNYDVEQIAVWVPPQREFTVDSEQLVAEPDQFREGNDYVGYSLTTPIESGDALTFTVSGGLVLEGDPQPTTTTSATPIEEDEPSDLGILVVGLGVILILSGVLYLIYDLQKARLKVQNTASEAASTTSKSALIEQIALLDGRYERGEIAEAVYQRQRQHLKEQLRRFYK